MPSIEQMTLTGFADQLETHITIDKVKTEVESSVRKEAQLLLSLLSSKPPSHTLCEDQSPYLSYHYDEGDMVLPDNFSFKFPLLSLDRSSLHFHTNESDYDSISDSGQEFIPSPPSALLLARQMTVNGPDELRSSAETMARNILQSFHNAVEWRVQQWIHSLSTVLVGKEKELLEMDVSEETFRELLDTPEARLLLCLRKAASEIEVVDTSTTFRVLSQRINHNEGGTNQGGTHPLKKRKVEVPASLQTETEYKYTVAHVLSFESVMNLSTPAGYSEVTIVAPGIIEGTFLSSDMGEDILTDVSVVVDTNVVAEAIERSSRIVARAAAHAIIVPTPDEEEDTPEEEEQVKELAPSPTQDKQTSYLDDAAAIVTPCSKSSPVYELTSEDGYVPIPDFDSDVVRMVSPQPRPPENQSFAFTPRTPTQNKVSVPNMVSPPPSSKNNEEHLSLSQEKSPSLPALVQVACAAMYAC